MHEERSSEKKGKRGCGVKCIMRQGAPGRVDRDRRGRKKGGETRKCNRGKMESKRGRMSGGGCLKQKEKAADRG